MLPVISRIDEPVPCSYTIAFLWNGACDSDAQVAAYLNAEPGLAVVAYAAAASEDVNAPKAGEAAAAEAVTPQASVAASAEALEIAEIAENAAAHVASSGLPHSTGAAAPADAPQPQAPAADDNDNAAAASAQEGARPAGE